MSYRIKSWKTEKIENLQIPIDSFFKEDKPFYHPEEFIDDTLVKLFFYRAGEIHGTKKDGIFYVEGIHFDGEGSAVVMQLIVEPALKDSKGVLVASCEWELGEGIVAQAFAKNELSVKDGVVEWSDIQQDSKNEK